MRPYELMYLMPPTADEERLGAISERLQTAITTLGGKIDKATQPARRRLATLDAEIERLQRARAYLQGALLCRFDHPATDCRIMGAEIDRRLASGV